MKLKKIRLWRLLLKLNFLANLLESPTFFDCSFLSGDNRLLVYSLVIKKQKTIIFTLTAKSDFSASFLDLIFCGPALKCLAHCSYDRAVRGCTMFVRKSNQQTILNCFNISLILGLKLGTHFRHNVQLPRNPQHPRTCPTNTFQKSNDWKNELAWGAILCSFLWGIRKKYEKIPQKILMLPTWPWMWIIG
jgi:hypothetical protein